MSKKNRPIRRPDQPAPAPSASPVGNSLQLAILAAIAILAVVSWASWRDVGKLEESLQTKLGEIEARVKSVSEKVDAVAAAKPQLPPQAKRLQPPDPNKVYAIKTDRAPVRGPGNAPITIAAFSDFQ
jgi:protein-disulfide isomerase